MHAERHIEERLGKWVKGRIGERENISYMDIKVPLPGRGKG